MGISRLCRIGAEFGLDDVYFSPFPLCKGDQWELHARRIVANFHAGYARHVDDPWWSEQFEALSQASREFREFWDSHEVLDAIDAPKTCIVRISGS